MEVKQGQKAKLKELEVTNRWMEVSQSEQKTGQTQQSNLPHEQAAVRLLERHLRLESCLAWQEVVMEGVATQEEIEDEGVAIEGQNASEA